MIPKAHTDLCELCIEGPDNEVVASHVPGDSGDRFHPLHESLRNGRPMGEHWEHSELGRDEHNSEWYSAREAKASLHIRDWE